MSFFFLDKFAHDDLSEDVKERKKMRVPIYTQWFFQRSLRRFGFPAGAIEQPKNSRIKEKERKEHKENVPPFSMGDEAEPRVWVRPLNFHFGTILYQKKSELVQFCTNFSEHKSKFFCLEYSFPAAPNAPKDDGLFIFFYFSGGPVAKKRCLHVEANGFFKGLHVEASSPFSWYHPNPRLRLG